MRVKDGFISFSKGLSTILRAAMRWNILTSFILIIFPPIFK